MNEKMMKMLKGKSKLSPLEKEAKMSVMKALSDDMSGELKNKLKGLKKVTVASDSPEGLKAGLEKAEEMVEGKMECEACQGRGCPMCPKDEDESEVAESEDMESEESEDMSLEDIEAQIAQLEKLKAMKARV